MEFGANWSAVVDEATHLVPVEPSPVGPETNSPSPGRDSGESVRGTMLGRLLGGSAVSLIGFVVTVLQAVVQVPLLLSVWSTEQFAVWITALSMHALLVSCDVGFHSFIGVEVILNGLHQRSAVRSLFASALRMWCVFSIIQAAFVCALWMLPWALTQHAPDGARLIRSSVQPLAVLVIQWIVIGSPLSLVCRVLLAGGQTVAFQWFGIAHRSLLFIATIAGVWCGLDVLGVATGYAVVASISAAVAITYVLRQYPSIVPHWSDGSWWNGFRLVIRSTGLTLSSLLEQLSTGGLTTVVAGTFHGLEVAAFSTMRSLSNFVSQAASVVMHPAVPELARSADSRTIHRAGFMIEAAELLGVAFLAIAVSVSCPWLPALYSAWTRHELPFDSILFTGLVAAVLVRQIGMPLQCFLLATNRVHPQFISSVIRSAVLYGSMPVFIARLGLGGIGAAVATAEACCAFYLLIVTRRCFVECGGRLPQRGIELAAAHVLTAVLVLWGVLVVGGSAPLWLGAAVVAHSMILIAEIRRIPQELASRLLAGLRITS